MRGARSTFTLPVRWPLVPVDAAAFYLDRRPDEVARDCDSLWAWDIARPGSQRRQLRIWRNSLLALKNPAEESNLPNRLDHVIESFLPKGGIRGSELQDLLFCTAHHIKTLRESGRLAVEHERRTTHGLNSTHTYTRHSVKDFLLHTSLLALPKLHPQSQN